jgi:N-formylglutamate deformylase
VCSVEHALASVGPVAIHAREGSMINDIANSDRTIYTLHRGALPLLVSVPHCGLALPDDVRSALGPRALTLEDTDWHLGQLYGFVVELGASLIVPTHSRYTIDLNRPADNVPMYPGANNTELCPTRLFTGEPLYADGQGPDTAEVDRRRARYWQPYHDALSQELDRLRNEHGHVVLFDGHSIKAELHLGTVDGTSCDTSLRATLANVLEAQSTYSHVVDGRFKGGYITRRYGQPIQGVHAVQLEMGWHTYLDDACMPPAWSQARVDTLLQTVLRPLVDVMTSWRAPR